MQKRVAILSVGISIFCVAHVWSMNPAHRLVRANVIRYACKRQSSTALVVVKQKSVREALKDWEITERKRRLRQFEEDDIRLLNALHSALFGFDEILSSLMLKQQALSEVIPFRKACYNNNLAWLPFCNAYDIVEDIEKLTMFDKEIQKLVQWSLNTSEEIKRRQQSLASVQDEQKRLAKGLWDA